MKKTSVCVCVCVWERERVNVYVWEKRKIEWKEREREGEEATNLREKSLLQYSSKLIELQWHNVKGQYVSSIAEIPR